MSCAPGAGIQVHQPDAGPSPADAAPQDCEHVDGGTADRVVPDGAPGLDVRADAAAFVDAARHDLAVTDAAPAPDVTAPHDASATTDRGSSPDSSVGDDAAKDAGTTTPDATTAADSATADTASPDSGPPAGQDTDGDGLDDAWEWAAGDDSLLDWQLADTDNDGTDDGAEDPDGDGLTNLQELAAARFTRVDVTRTPHPLRRDLLVELDSMAGRDLSDEVLAASGRVFADLNLVNVDGSQGVQLHIVRDEQDLTAVEFDGSFTQRQTYLSSHGPQIVDSGFPPLPLDRMIHVVVARWRTDDTARGGETVAHATDIEKSGVFVYYDAIDALHPACGRPVEPVLPDITLDEALATTLAHELGHTLQLGHDTTTGGGINYFNIMSQPQSCLQAQMRMHGDGNTDPDLGATSLVAEPRFSHAAAALLHLDSIISVDASDFDQAGGYEM
ncbi:MAG: hypothetical protein ABIJ09_16370 [Pseudomonadota bacterium]